MPLPSVHEAFLASPSSRGLGLRMVTQKCGKLYTCKHAKDVITLWTNEMAPHLLKLHEMTLVLPHFWCKKASNQLAPALSGAGFMPKAGEFWLDRPFLLPPSVETLNKGPQKKDTSVGRIEFEYMLWLSETIWTKKRTAFLVPNWFPYLPCLVVFPTKLAVQAPTSTKWKESEALLPARRRTGPCWGEALVPGMGGKKWYFQFMEKIFTVSHYITFISPISVACL